MKMTSHRTFHDWRTAYKGNSFSIGDMVSEVLARCSQTDPAWITLLSEMQLRAQAEMLHQRALEEGSNPAYLPLYGIPFAVKDNIDVKGLPTTAACPDFSYIAKETAPVVQHLMDAGAILVGKTNMDQFATGLVGVRSPYGAVPNSFNPEYISGGSSSGSASVVARGLVAFSLGTDTAGSGRVPAGCNNIVGLKPSRGALSIRGVVPACRTLDCVSIFSLTVEDAEDVYRIAAQYDVQDPYSRHPEIKPRNPASTPVFAYPERLEFFGDTLAAESYYAAFAHLESLDIQLVPIDFSLLHRLANLLYDGPWVAERYAALADFFEEHKQDMDPIVAQIIGSATHFSAADAFKAEYTRKDLLRGITRYIQRFDALVVPTAPTIYTIDAVLADPLQLNTRLGTYTNFVNLADWCALALPGPMRGDGLPAGITLIGPTWGEPHLMDFAKIYSRHFPWTLGNSQRQNPVASFPEYAHIAVVGAHLSGMPLNNELTERRAIFVTRSKTSANYRLFHLTDNTTPKPGLIRCENGMEQELEIWALPMEEFGSFVTGIASPLGIGHIELENGDMVQGFLCESWAVKDAPDISAYGGWRSFVNRHM
ncbi:MAG: allophanate hydrolase [Spartobacteria bacterium]|nr:allophanate hydrolase [Spartobacteria bacterium]